MRILKIVHTGDFHIGSLFTSTPEVASQRRVDQINALRKTVEMTNEKESDALLIAGDLFDSLKVDAQVLSETKAILGACKCDVFIAPGNHDPATPDSCYAQGEVWPDNVHIFRSGLEYFEIPDKNACIWGAAFTRSFQLEPLVQDVTIDDTKINILLIHGDLYSGSQSESKYNPVSSEFLCSSGFEYVALGHIHKPEMHRNGDLLYGYCGVPEPRGFDEQGEKGIWAGYVSKNFAHVDFFKICSRKYISDTVDVSGCSVTPEFCEALLKTLEKRHGKDYEKNLYDITLKGELPRGVMADIPVLTSAMREKLHYVRFTDTTTTELDINMLGKDTTLRGAFARAISNKIQKDERNRDKYLRALLYGLRAFDGEVIVSDDK